MAEVDLGKVMMTDAELANFILQFNGGLKIGKFEDGTPGYYKKEDETGEETLTPFKSGGGGLEGGFDLIVDNSNSSATRLYPTLTRDYKAMIVLSFVGQASSSPSLSVGVPNEAYGGQWTLSVGTGRLAIALKVDLGEHKEGETYEVTLSGSPAARYTKIIGLY